MLQSLYCELAGVFSGHTAIERHARDALLAADTSQIHCEDIATELPPSILNVMAEPDAHPVCRLIAQASFQWAPPQTSSDPLYVQHSLPKVHVELLGPDGLIKSDQIRLGLYGMLPGAEYGIRTHPAEELYVMLAGQVYWKRGTDAYQLHASGERSYHPSMLEHANRTEGKAFMSVYVWHGDISTDNYVYSGASPTS